jgi:hemolysin activation/secretion protein
MENRNLTGFSDALSLRYGVFSGGLAETDSAGADNLRFHYSRPVWWDDTSLEFFCDRQGYAIIEDPFTDLDITGFTWSAGTGVRRPLYRDLQDSVWWGMSLSRKHSETELLGEPFSVSPGYVDGELDLTLLQTGVDWVRRGESEVLTANIGLVAGLDAMGATDAPTEPDSSFIAVRANASYLARLNSSGHLLSIRGAMQWADDALPSPEQWTLGGYSSVRGYRQNDLVRDAGALAGVEYRVPAWSGSQGELTLVSFLDGGVGMDVDGDHQEALLSVGVGFTGSYRSWLRGELFWGIPLVNRDDTGNDLQDHGIHFRLIAGKF